MELVHYFVADIILPVSSLSEVKRLFKRNSV